MTPLQNTAVYGAFFMEGLHDAGYQKAIDSYAQGCLEMVIDMCAHVEFLVELVKPHLESDESFPGVLDYEVSSPFGKWFGLHLHEHCEVPSKELCEAELTRLVTEFFAQ